MVFPRDQVICKWINNAFGAWGGGLGYTDVILNYHALPVNIYGFKTGSSRKELVFTLSGVLCFLWSSSSLNPSIGGYILEGKRDGIIERISLMLIGLECFYPWKEGPFCLCSQPAPSVPPLILHLWLLFPPGSVTPFPLCLVSTFTQLRGCDTSTLLLSGTF